MVRDCAGLWVFSSVGCDGQRRRHFWHCLHLSFSALLSLLCFYGKQNLLRNVRQHSTISGNKYEPIKALFSESVHQRLMATGIFVSLHADLVRSGVQLRHVRSFVSKLRKQNKHSSKTCPTLVRMPSHRREVSVVETVIKYALLFEIFVSKHCWDNAASWCIYNSLEKLVGLDGSWYRVKFYAYLGWYKDN